MVKGLHNRIHTERGEGRKSLPNRPRLERHRKPELPRALRKRWLSVAQVPYLDRGRSWWRMVSGNARRSIPPHCFFVKRKRRGVGLLSTVAQQDIAWARLPSMSPLLCQGPRAPLAPPPPSAPILAPLAFLFETESKASDVVNLIAADGKLYFSR
ncbi:hypothetical protein CDAR_571671 [Caerostris darwini]|uniref:Uncharacterized protein n=1 Tax=Caerostris darwini TaxID=1538125 RepID=A0AAV4WHM9_9ARAC|nr:hypothetical protein CDAR_571671 [Caerostris darwini]